MKALVKTQPGIGHLELREWPEPSPAPHEIKIRIAAAAICGTDLHILQGRWRCDPPVVLGHEFCGSVVDIGSQVRSFRVGDRIVGSNPAKVCGLCYHCMAGNPFMCSERVSAGYMIDGAFAEYLCIRPEVCHLLPDNVSFKAASMGEPLSVAIHSVIERSMIHAGDLALVSGPGAIGLLTMLIARLEGARVVIAGLDKDTRRLKRARELGADIVVNVSHENLLEVVNTESTGRGVDLAYECAGSQDSLDSCLDAIRKEGTIIQAGVFPGPVQTDLNRIMMKELNFIGTYGYVWTSWHRAIQLLAQEKLDIESLITHEFPIEDYEEAFKVTQDGSAVKVIVKP